MRTTVSLIALSTLLAAGCADDLDDSGGGPDAGSQPGADAAETTSPITSTDNGDGSTTTTVDASSESEWVYFSFAGGHVEPAAPESSSDWDLAFQRFTIRVNGGVSGPGQVEIAFADGADFDAFTAPADGWVTDEADGNDDGVPEYAFSVVGGGWYDYNPSTHVLTAKDRVYAIRKAGGSVARLSIVDYYDEHGSSGHPSFRWAPMASTAR